MQLDAQLSTPWPTLIGFSLLALVGVGIALNLQEIAKRHPHRITSYQRLLAAVSIVALIFSIGLQVTDALLQSIEWKGMAYISVHVGALAMAGCNGVWYGIQLRKVVEETSKTREQLIEKQLLMQSVSQSQQNLLLKEKVRESQRKHLKSQMNPHFIFNVLTGIQNLLQSAESKKAGLVFSRFRRLLMLGFMSQDRVLGPLSQEIDHVNQYLELERIRLSNPIHFEWNIAPDVLPQMVPCPLFILQPLVENAIWHGLNGSIVEPALKISVRWRDQDLVIAVSDNGQGLDQATHKPKTHQSRGTSIVRERLALLRHRGELRIQDRPNGHPFSQGVTAELHLPLWALEPAWHANEKRKAG